MTSTSLQNLFHTFVYHVVSHPSGWWGSITPWYLWNWRVAWSCSVWELLTSSWRPGSTWNSPCSSNLVEVQCICIQSYPLLPESPNLQDIEWTLLTNEEGLSTHLASVHLLTMREHLLESESLWCFSCRLVWRMYTYLFLWRVLYEILSPSSLHHVVDHNSTQCDSHPCRHDSCFGFLEFLNGFWFENSVFHLRNHHHLFSCWWKGLDHLILVRANSILSTC